MQQVKDWMTEAPITIAPEASVLEALQELTDGGFRHLPVVSSEGLVGILALEDLRAALSFPVSLRPLSRSEREQALEYRVGEWMTYSPHAATPDMALAAAASVMVQERIGCLPVVDAGKLVGILSTSDALAALVALLEPREAAVEALGTLDRLVRDLRAERARIVSQLDAREAAERQLSAQADVEPGDVADRASLVDQVTLQGTLADMASRRLAAIDRALDRQRRGEFGTCATCGKPIPVARLRAQPGTSRCVICSAETERA